MTIRESVLKALVERGPQSISDLRVATNLKRRQVEDALNDLNAQGKSERMEDGTFRALAGESEPEAPGSPPAGGSPAADETSLRQPLSGDQERFKKMLVDCDVRRALETITDSFFAGNPDDLNHLVSVLEDARAYVQPLQKRLMVRYWASFIHRDLPQFLEERLNRPEGEKGDRNRPGSEFIEDIGWKVEKDRDGEWAPRPGGELT